eukprot:1152962-Pelagomonas_calceolata.AAC.8
MSGHVPANACAGHSSLHNLHACVQLETDAQEEQEEQEGAAGRQESHAPAGGLAGNEAVAKPKASAT